MKNNILNLKIIIFISLLIFTISTADCENSNEIDAMLSDVKEMHHWDLNGAEIFLRDDDFGIKVNYIDVESDFISKSMIVYVRDHSGIIISKSGKKSMKTEVILDKDTKKDFNDLFSELRKSGIEELSEINKKNIVKVLEGGTMSLTLITSEGKLFYLRFGGENAFSEKKIIRIIDLVHSLKAD